MTTIATTSQPATSSLKRLISGHPLLAYFIIAFAGTWVPLLPFALSRGVNGLGLLPYFPLASGLLSGKYNKGTPPGSRATLAGYEWLRESVMTPKNIEKVKQLEPIAKNLDCTMAQLALAWCLKNPNVSTVITGATRPEQVVENMKAPDIVPKLEPEVMEQIEQVLENEPRSNED